MQLCLELGKHSVGEPQPLRGLHDLASWSPQHLVERANGNPLPRESSSLGGRLASICSFVSCEPVAAGYLSGLRPSISLVGSSCFVGRVSYKTGETRTLRLRVRRRGWNICAHINYLRGSVSQLVKSCSSVHVGATCVGDTWACVIRTCVM